MILKIHSKIILLIVVLIFAVNFFYDERKLFYLGCENHRRNSKKAYIYYLIATLKGSPRSENHLGFMYLDGKGVKKNRYKAFKYFKSAAEKGFGYAQHNLGSSYASGWGTLMDHNKACAYYSKAAEQGVTYSRQVMRIFYSRGCGAFAIPVGMDLAIYDSRWLLRSYLNSFGFYPNPPIKDV